MDPGTGIAILGSALGGAKVIEKMLGPTADYVGDGLRNWTENRVKNVANIFSNAEQKLGNDINKPGSIPPRVLKEVLDGGSFCDDPLTTEYFGGVLASSRTGVSRDDRGASWSSLVARLSTYQVRSHFIIYRAIFDRFKGQDFKFNMDDRSKLSVFVTYSSYCVSMEFTDDELSRINSLFSHSLFGLKKEDLVESFAFGQKESLTKQIGDTYAMPEEGGILVTPSALGAELFLWAHGLGDVSIADFLNQEFTLPENIICCESVPKKDPQTPN